MSLRHKKYLSAGLAGMLCSTALFVLTAAHAQGKNNLTLPRFTGTAGHSGQFLYAHVS